MLKDNNAFYYFKCPLCSGSIEVPKKWAENNGRVYCQTCCKSFEVDTEGDSREEF